MKRLFFVAVLALSCSSPVETPDPGGPAVCDGGPDSPSATVQRKLAVIGASVNVIRREGDQLFFIESGDNTVSRFDLSTQSSRTLVDVGNERGPWDLWIGEEELWITNFLTNTVTVARREDGEVLVEISDPSFDGPSGITALGDFVFVGNVHFEGDNDYGDGTVTVIDRGSRQVLGSIPTARKNPQALDVANGRVVVVASGGIAFDAQGAYAGSEAAVELWTPTSDPLEPQIVEFPLPVVDDRTIGVPGRPAHQSGSNVIYFASGTAPVVFALDIETESWRRGSDNPIRLYDTDRDALQHAAVGDDGVLYVTAFNEDKLYLVDTSCDEVLREVELEGSSMLAGPHGVVPVVVPYGVDAYFVLSLANELGRVQLKD